MDLNIFAVSGRLTRDCEMKKTANGMTIAEFSIASNYKKKSYDSYVDEVSFLDFAIFGKRADGLAKYLTKGRQVNLKGWIRQDRWDRDGERRSKITFVVDDLQLIGGQGQTEQKPQKSPQAGYREDEIPFF